jgi:hypothetical protein
MSSKVIIKCYDGRDEEIATCQFGDDAEVLFNHYKSLNSYVRVEYIGTLSNEVTLEHFPTDQKVVE